MHNGIIYKNINMDDFSPTLLRCSFFTEGKNMPKGFGLGKRYVYDYELEYFTYGGGTMIIENKVYSINKGDIVFRRPGQYVEGIMPYCCYLICFDLTGTSGKSYKDYNFSMPQEFEPYYRNSILDIIPDIFHPSSAEKYHGIFQNILEEFINPCGSTWILLRSLMLRLIYEIHEDVSELSSGIIDLISSPHYTKLKKAKDYISENFDKKIVLEDMSAVTGLSATYFHRVFTEAFSITPNEYINKVRMDKARELLVKTTLPVNTIALLCGYDNIPYFSTSFKKYNQISPGEFRKKYCYT
jgi:AraC family transcriptional regulator